VLEKLVTKKKEKTQTTKWLAERRIPFHKEMLKKLTL
jgi:hypothetical protein